jgi:hypothetical protein
LEASSDIKARSKKTFAQHFRCADAQGVALALSDPFFQGYGHGLTHILSDRLANVCPNWQFMCAITQSHERTPKRVAIDFSPHLYLAAGPEEFD